MMRAVLVALALFATASSSPAFAQVYEKAPGREDISLVPDADTEMAAAIAKARATLPLFWDALKSGQAQNYGLKVGMQTRSGGLEHIWVRDVARIGDGNVRATLDNEPADIPNVAINAPVTFKEAEISDWFVVCNGRMYGNYTTRVIFAHMSEAERKSYADIIAAMADGAPCEGPSV